MHVHSSLHPFRWIKAGYIHYPTYQCISRNTCPSKSEWRHVHANYPTIQDILVHPHLLVHQYNMCHILHMYHAIYIALLHAVLYRAGTRVIPMLCRCLLGWNCVRGCVMRILLVLEGWRCRRDGWDVGVRVGLRGRWLGNLVGLEVVSRMEEDWEKGLDGGGDVEVVSS